MRTMTLPILGLLFGLFNSPFIQADDSSLVLIVMDPLAAPLSCPCVEGYAQRKYEVLAEQLESELGQKVQLEYAPVLSEALKKTNSKADIIIGKDSVVRHDAKAANVKVTPIAQLTDKTGSTKQQGLIVVNKDDPAKTVSDLNNYTIIFGPSEADEKHSAALHLLTSANITIPKTLEIDDACSDGACKVIDLGPKSKSAAVISSYAQPLLEGCGTIKKGDLRVVGETVLVPFISVFVTESVDKELQEKIMKKLLAIGSDRSTLKYLESLAGFVYYESAETKKN
jgi:ABC-type phosphate/phosphonate transport system substrate-binding protein